MDHAARGDKALDAKDYKAALAHYTRALATHPHSPAYHIKRSTALLRLRPADGGPRYLASLADAELALLLARRRGKRELALEAQLRRAIALYHLERYGDARVCLEDVRAAYPAGQGGGKVPRELAPLDVWEKKVEMQIGVVGEEEEARRTTVKRVPEFEVPGEEELRRRYAAEAEGDGWVKDAGGQGVADAKAGEERERAESIASGSSQQTAEPATKPAQDIRHEWYQTHDDVVITLYAKGVPKDQARAEFGERSLSLTVPTPRSGNYNLSFNRLYHPIDLAASSVKVMSMKVEVRLRKKTPGLKWSTLEDTTNAQPDESAASHQPAPTPAPSTNPQSIAGPLAPSTAKPPSGPYYPTSSRTGIKDWDKLAAELVRKEKSKKTQAAQTNGKSPTPAPTDAAPAATPPPADDDAADDSDDSDLGADPVDKFFKKLYAGADPDTRRAMMKSYIESEGTALSTNWSEVGKGRVEPHKGD